MDATKNLKKSDQEKVGSIVLGYDPSAIVEAYNRYFTSFVNFYSEIYNTFGHAFLSSIEEIGKEIDLEKDKSLLDFQWIALNNKQKKSYEKIEKKVLSKIRNAFDTDFRDDHFVN